MSSTIDFDTLIRKECETCEKPCLVFPHHEGDVECENCYLTKLELEKTQKEEIERKVFKIWRMG